MPCPVLAEHTVHQLSGYEISCTDIAHHVTVPDHVTCQLPYWDSIADVALFKSQAVVYDVRYCPSGSGMSGYELGMRSPVLTERMLLGPT
eukprot:983425-Rhodomonas_salina.4